MRAPATLLLFPVAVLLALGSATCATLPRAVKDIDARCTAAATLDDAHKQGLHIVADVSGAVRPMPNDGRGKWIPFRSDQELRRYAEENDAPNTQAWTWRAPDGTFIASMFFQSDSGDWSHTVGYCFRDDGTLARSQATLVNFAANVDGSRTTYYATDGRVLFSSAKSGDSEGKPRTLDGLDSPPVYPTVKSLPFNAPGVAGPPAQPSVGTSSERPTPAAVDGTLDPNAVANQVKSQLGAVKACYERELKKNPDLTGRFVVVWTIEPAGTSTGVTVENPDPHLADVATCIVELIGRWRFPARPTGRPIDVSFPFVFKSTREGKVAGPQSKPK